MRQILRREDAQGPEKRLGKPLEGEGPLFLEERFPPSPLLPQKTSIKTACITGSLFLWLAQVEGCSCSGKNSAPSTAGRRKDALKRLDGSIKYHLCFPCQAREFANTIPLDVDGDTAALQYFRFEHLHSQSTPIPIHAQARCAKRRPSGKSFWKGGARGGRTFFQKGFPPRKLFLPSNLQASACRPPNKKIPGGAGTKKDPLALRAARGSSNNLWQRPTFPHDVMQYHRRWRA